MPKIIDGTWKGEIGQRQIREWEKENAGKPIDTRTNYEKLMDEKAGIKTFNDAVNNPPHYQKGGMETIDIMENLLPVDEFIGYLKGCIIKYISRYEHKEKPLEDLAKAEWYVKKLKDTRTKHDAYITLEKHVP